MTVDNGRLNEQCCKAQEWEMRLHPDRKGHLIWKKKRNKKCND
jgi:hypothetical protein